MTCKIILKCIYQVQWTISVPRITEPLISINNYWKETECMIKVLDLLLSVMKEPNSYYGWWCNYYIKTSQPGVKISVMKTLQSLGNCFHFSKSWEVFLNYYYCFNLLFHLIWFCFTRLIDHNDTNRVSVESSESESLKCASEWMVSFMAS